MSQSSWLSNLEMLLKVYPEIPYEKLQQSKLKRAYVARHFSCCTYINSQDKYDESRFILSTRIKMG